MKNPLLFACTALSLFFAFGMAVARSSPPDVVVSFEDFLKTPPATIRARIDIENGWFRKQKGGMDASNAARQNCSFVWVEGSYLLTNSVANHANKTYGGVFDGVPFNTSGDVLVNFDSRINPPGQPKIPELANRLPVYRLINLGLQEMVPGTIVWKDGENEFTADAVMGVGAKAVKGMISVRLHYEEGVPSSAIVSGFGKHSSIRYTYHPDFFAGQIPIGITRFLGPSFEGIPNFSLHIKDLELLREPVPADQVDPRIVLKDKIQSEVIWSNGINYWKLPDGRLEPVPTAAEAGAKPLKAKSSKKFQKLIIVLASAITLFCIAYFIRVNIRKNQRQ